MKKRDWEDEIEKGNKERTCRKIDDDRKEKSTGHVKRASRKNASSADR